MEEDDVSDDEVEDDDDEEDDEKDDNVAEDEAEEDDVSDDEVEEDGHVTRAILCRNSQEKCCTPRSRCRLCASLCNRHAHGHQFSNHFSREFTGKRAVSQSEHLDQSPTVKTTQVWTLEKTFFEVCKVQLASSTFPANSICYLQEP